MHFKFLIGCFTVLVGVRVCVELARGPAESRKSRTDSNIVDV